MTHARLALVLFCFLVRFGEYIHHAAEKAKLRRGAPGFVVAPAWILGLLPRRY